MPSGKQNFTEIALTTTVSYTHTIVQSENSLSRQVQPLNTAYQMHFHTMTHLAITDHVGLHWHDGSDEV